MYFVQFRVEQRSQYGLPRLEKATAWCWVHTSSPVLAEARARRHLARTGFDVEEVTEIRAVRRSEFVEDSEALRQFDRAMAASSVAVQIHGGMWARRDDPTRPPERAV